MTNIRFSLHRPQLREVLIRGEATIREAMGPPARHRKGDVLINTGEDSRIYLLPRKRESGATAVPFGRGPRFRGGDGLGWIQL